VTTTNGVRQSTPSVTARFESWSTVDPLHYTLLFPKMVWGCLGLVSMAGGKNNVLLSYFQFF